MNKKVKKGNERRLVLIYKRLQYPTFTPCPQIKITRCERSNEQDTSLSFVQKTIGCPTFGLPEIKSRKRVILAHVGAGPSRGVKSGQDVYWHFHRSLTMLCRARIGGPQIVIGEVVIADKDQNLDVCSFQNRKTPGVMRITIIQWRIPDKREWIACLDVVRGYCSELQEFVDKSVGGGDSNTVEIVHSINMLDEISVDKETTVDENGEIRAVRDFFSANGMKYKV